MAIDLVASTIAVRYERADGTALTGLAEADGTELAVVETAVVDTLGNPVPHVRVMVALDLLTPDPTGRVAHDHEDPSVKAGAVLAASLTNAQGLARARITSRDHTYAPLVARSRVYQDDGLAGPWKRPGASGARPTGPQQASGGSIAGQTYAAPATAEARTITGQVTVTSDGVVFED